MGTLSAGDARRMAGISDALEITRETANRIDDGRRTQTVTLGQLDQAIGDLAARLEQPGENDRDLASRLAEFSALAETIADISRALSIESNADAGEDLVFWAEAVCAAIESHSREFSGDAMKICTDHLLSLAKRARTMALEMEFGFLLDKDRKLLSIGYLASEGQLQFQLL